MNFGYMSNCQKENQFNIVFTISLLLKKVKLNIIFGGRQTIGKSEENTKLEVLKEQREKKSSHVPFYKGKKKRSVQ